MALSRQIARSFCVLLLLSACGEPPERPPACVPSCDGKACGDDGCGGVCGSCEGDAECRDGSCITAPSCTDEVRNGDETDVDCGGSCPKCANGRVCDSEADCRSNICSNGTCRPEPTCTDNTKNGEESDADCGGSTCDPCATGRFCRSGDDCLSAICRNGVCRDPSCDDGLKNQNETDVDCGGICPVKCADGDACGQDADCASGVCESGRCVTCRNACSQGQSRCVGDQVQTCLEDARGCFDWSEVSTCGTGRVCDAVSNRCADLGCGEVPISGRCLDPSTIEYCALATGGGVPFVRTRTCEAFEACVETDGQARCESTATCRAGESRCASTSTLETCADGDWVSSTCPHGCNGDNPLGAFCRTQIPTRSFQGSLKYEARFPNAGRTDWGPPTAVPAQGFLVLSMADLDGTGTVDVIDVAFTDGSGAFEIDVATSPRAPDSLVFVAAGVAPDGSLRFAVGDPGLETGALRQVGELGQPRLWSWAWNLLGLDGHSDLMIDVAHGSGAARVFDYMRYVHSVSDGLFADPGLSVVAWVGFGTSWTCGACFAPVPATVFSERFDSQIWLGGDATNEAYWSDAVTAHELGHWAMASFGTSPQEGGPHFLGRPTFPGQAWSEGFATWFSSIVRDSPLYIDKQNGGMFWLDIAARQYGGGSHWIRPTPQGGLHQKMDENEVAAMLWSLSGSSPNAAGELLAALGAAQMNTSPWPRGYTRHVWEVTATGDHVNVLDTGISRPFVADFFDTLLCDGFPSATLDSATQPGTRYPFPSGSPICTGGCSSQSCDGCCLDGVCQPGNVAGACGANGLQCVACNPGQTCVNGACVGGTCDATTCSDGCCTGTTCITAQSASACGSGGEICRICQSGQICEDGACTGGEGFLCQTGLDCGRELVCLEETETVARCRELCASRSDCRAGFNCIELEDGDGACVPAPGVTSRWKVGFWTALIRVPNPADGQAWDADGSLPDPYICLKVGSGSRYCSSTQANTDEPVWLEVTSADFDHASLAAVQLELWDEDLLSDDFIDRYEVDIRSAWAGQEWTTFHSHAEDTSAGSIGVLVWVSPSE